MLFVPAPASSVSSPPFPVRVSLPEPPFSEFAPSLPTSVNPALIAEPSSDSAVVPVVAPLASAILTVWMFVKVAGTAKLWPAVELVKRIVFEPVPPSTTSPVASDCDWYNSVSSPPPAFTVSAPASGARVFTASLPASELSLALPVISTAAAPVSVKSLAVPNVKLKPLDPDTALTVKPFAFTVTTPSE